MAASKSVAACLIDIFVAPGEAIVAAREQRRWFWLPLGLVIGAGVAMWIWYYRTVDFGWLNDHMLAGRNLTPEQMK
ncbi:MAG TPA: hypothetical protein VFL54_05140, partial [Gammaproteobacteria bacterium]|nr:hypothetical protein [Gammaproteobacteria bacterium]